MHSSSFDFVGLFCASSAKAQTIDASLDSIDEALAQAPSEREKEAFILEAAEMAHFTNRQRCVNYTALAVWGKSMVRKLRAQH